MTRMVSGNVARGRPASTWWGRHHWLVILPVGLAIALRVAFLIANWDSPFFTVPLIDAQSFHEKAALLAAGEELPARPYDRPPGFILFAAFLYRVFGTDMRVVIVAQQVIGAMLVALTVWLGWRLFGLAVGLIAGGILALARLPIVLEGQLLNETLQTILLLGSAALLLLARERRRGPLLVSGAVMGALAILTRPTSALFVVPAMVVVLVSRSRRARDGSARAGRSFPMTAVIPALLLFIVISGSAAVRNRVVGKEWVPVSYNGGINFFIGNASRSDELINIRPGLAWDRLVQSPRALERTHVFDRDPWADGFAAWDRRYYDAALEDMLADPGAAVARFARKAAQFWAAREIDRNLDPSAFVQPGSLPARASLPFALIGPPALAGALLLALRRPRGWAVVLGLIAAVWAAGIIFFVTSRYRAPAYPAMAIAAGYLVVALVSGARQRSVGQTAMPIGLLALALAIGITDPGGSRRIAPARGTFLRGLALERSGDLRGALEVYREALVEYPDDPDVLMQPTAFLNQSGQSAAAAALAERATSVLPDHPVPLFNLGLAYAALGQSAEAAAAFARMTGVNPRDPRGFYQLGRNLIDAGSPAEALSPLERAASMAPEMPLPLIELARVHVRLGRAAEARREIAAALRIDPGATAAMRGYPELAGLGVR